MKSDRRIMLLILGLALVVRFMYLLENTASPYFVYPVLDELYLDNEGLRIAHGVPSEPKPYFRGPLYPAFLGAVYSISEPDRFFIVRLIQHVMGSLFCVMVFLVGRETFGRRAGIIAGMLAVFYGPSVFHEGEILIESMFLFLNMATLLFMVMAAKSGGIRYFLLGGLALALATACRSNIVPFIPFAVLWALLLPAAGNVRKRLARAVAVAVPVAALLLMMLARNYIVSKEFVVLSTQGGVNFYLGNGPKADGKSPPTKMTFGTRAQYRDNVEVASEEVVQEALQRPVIASEVSDTWYGTTYGYIAAHPARWIALMAKKKVLFWNDHEIKNVKNYDFSKRYSMFLKYGPVTFGIVGALGLFGAVLALWPRRNAPSILLVLYVLTFMGSIILFFVCDRLRLPVIAGLFPLAGVAGDHLITAVAGRRKSLLLTVPALAVLLTFTYVDWYRIKSTDYSQELWTVGQLYFNLGEYDQAVAALKESVEQKPSPGPYVTMGHSYLQKKDFQHAAESYYAATAIEPNSPYAYNGLGVASERSGNITGAMDSYRHASELDPRYAKPVSNLGMLLAKQRRLEEARLQLEKAIALDPNDPDPYMGMALCAYLSGDEPARVKYLNEAVKRGTPAYLQFYEEAVKGMADQAESRFEQPPSQIPSYGGPRKNAKEAKD